MRKRKAHAQFRAVSRKELAALAVQKAGPVLLKALEAVIQWRITASDDRSKMPNELYHKCMTAIREAKGR